MGSTRKSDTALIPVDEAYVMRYRSTAAREGFGLRKTATPARWFRTPGHEGFGGLIAAGAGKLRMNDVYVLPEFRGLGHGTRITEGLIAIALSEVDTVEGVARRPKFFTDRGFKKITRLSGGRWRVALTRRRP